MQTGTDRPQLLFIDDQAPFQKYLAKNFGSNGFDVIAARHWHEAKTFINEGKIHPAIVFFEPLSNGGALELLQDIRSEIVQTPIVVLSALRDPKSIRKAMLYGARDYVCKPVDSRDLHRTIDEIINKKQTITSSHEIRKIGKVDFIFHNPKMQQIHDTVLQIANERIPVLLQGESGVGKEIIARMVHQYSKWCKRPFVKVNCAAVPAELAESELFGYEKGAFTGAYIDRPGKFEFANGGTIFLDEITEFTPAIQAKLLQVLQDGRFTRLGSNQEIEVDVRVIAATNQKLEEAIEKGTFREDLYYRLNVVNIEIPPLRERKDEINLFCAYFLEKFSKQDNGNVSKLPEGLNKLFQAYQWRGNVRELENLIKRYVVMQDEESIRMELEAKVSSQKVDEMTDSDLQENGGTVDLKEIAKRASVVAEKNMILRTLFQTNWNKWKAAKQLKVSYKTLLTKIGQYGITNGSCLTCH